MTFSIAKDMQKRNSFGNYEYSILRDGAPFAIYWHDFRGDDSGLKFSSGKEIQWPLGDVSNFLDGGGSKPITLSKRAEKLLLEFIDG